MSEPLLYGPLKIWNATRTSSAAGTYKPECRKLETGLFASRRYDGISYPIEQFWRDAREGKLANVVFVDPNYTDRAEDMGTSNDSHPWDNLLVAEGFLAKVHDALKNGPQWDRMVFVLNFDEHGGFFDHLPPPECQDDTKLAGPGSASELEASRLQGSGDSHGTIRAAQDRNGGALGALLHPQDDRMALGPRADDSARPLREELRRGARLHAAAAGDRSSALRSTAGKGLRRWRRVARASSLARRLRKGYLRWTSECRLQRHAHGVSEQARARAGARHQNRPGKQGRAGAEAHR